MSDTTRISEPQTATQTYENRDSVDGSKRLPTGYDGDTIPEDFFIPECRLEDIDKSMFEFFDKTLQMTVSQKNKQLPVPVIFATGERFALVKRKKPIRDSNGATILPLISIRRSGLSQSISQAARGRDIGDLTIKRRLSAKDLNYQNSKNKQNLTNQDNVATSNHVSDIEDPVGVAKPGTVGNREYKSGPTAAGLNHCIGDNIYELITIPFPKFVRMTYEVTFWTQYTTHMNSMIEQLMIAYHAPGNNFKLTTDKGYWFVGYVQDDFSDGNNFDDFTDQERIVRYSFSVVVDGYLVANDPAGLGSPFRSYFSAPVVNFGMESQSAEINIGGRRDSPVGSSSPDDFILGEVEILDRDGNPKSWRGRPLQQLKVYIRNPFSGNNKPQYLQVLSSDSRTGESVMSGLINEDLGDLNLTSEVEDGC
jgi:hypothetical protein